MRNPRADAREPPKSFFFDAVFGDRSAQERVYEVCGAPLVESVLQGYNGTIFAYGQVKGRNPDARGRKCRSLVVFSPMPAVLFDLFSDLGRTVATVVAYQKWGVPLNDVWR